MKISIEEIEDTLEEEIIIRCHGLSDSVLQIINRLKSREEMLIGYEGQKIHRVALKDVYYFEAVDNKVFLYNKAQVLETRQKLYEIEQMYGGGNFLRTSKSVILNIKKIKYVSPAYNGRFEACLDNGETQVISRQYVAALKKKLMVS